MKRSLFFIIISMMLSLASHAQNKRPDSYNYTRAVEAIQNNNVKEALDYLNKEVSDNPKNGYAYSWLAYVREYQSEYGQALTAADKAVKFIPSKDTEYVIFALSIRARTYHNLEQDQQALSDYARAIKAAPDNIKLYEERAQLLFELKEYDLANRDYNKIIEIDQGNVMGYMGLGRNAKAKKEYRSAIDKFSYVTRLSPTYSSGYSFRAATYVEMKKYDEAIDDIITALDIDDDNKAFYLMQDVADSAFVQLSTKLKIQANSNPSNSHWPYYLGLVYELKDKYHQALNYYEKSNKIEIKGITIERIAECYDELGDYNRAIGYIDTAIEMDSTNCDYLLDKANYLDNAGRFKEALSILDIYLTKKPRSYTGYYRRGWIKDHTGDRDGAIEDYTMTISLFPEYAYSYMVRGRAYYLMGEKDLARADFEEAIRRDTLRGSDNASMYSYFYLGQREEALNLLNKVLEKKSKGNYYEAACMYSLMGEKEKSLECLRKALEGGYYRFAHMRRDKDLDNIRDTPEFESLLREFQEVLKKEVSNDTGDGNEYEEKVSEVPFTRSEGVYKVKCEINDLPLHFVFDTGAADLSISNVEATFMLKNNYLKPSDIVGRQNYINANGEVIEGTVINLKKVDFAGLSLSNVKASVVKNQVAPLLLGQSVLGRLGKIEIDNDKKLLKVTMRKRK